MVLAHSLRDNGTRKQLAALVTLDTLSASTIGELKVHILLQIRASYTDQFLDNL